MSINSWTCQSDVSINDVSINSWTCQSEVICLLIHGHVRLT